MIEKCSNCHTYAKDYVHWKQYKNGKKTIEAILCKDCFAEQCIYNSMKIFVQSPITYNIMLKKLSPYLLKDKDLTEDQKKTLQNFLKIN